MKRLMHYLIYNTDAVKNLAAAFAYVAFSVATVAITYVVATTWSCTA